MSEGVEPQRFRLRDVAVSAFGPTALSATGHGAVLPILVLRATELGAGPGVAAFVFALVGLGSLTASLPAGALVARIGERKAIMLAGSVDVLAMAVAALTDSVVLLAVAAYVSGLTWTVFLLARQGFMIDAAPVWYRARALSVLGASHRIGVLVGPLIGAALISLSGLSAVFWLAALMSASSAALARVMPDLGAGDRADQQAAGHLSVWSVLRGHADVLATLGIAVVVLAASRAIAPAIVPLWAADAGVSASTISLLFSIAAAVDLAVAFPGGTLMDRRGRAWAAIPVATAAALGLLLLPLTDSAVTIGAVLVLIGLGNGLGSGIVMTLGADAAPVAGRAQFLGGWRMCGDVGMVTAPLAVAGAVTLVPLAAASLALGFAGLAGACWVGYWTVRADRTRRAT